MFSPETHFDEDGSIIHQQDHKYLWIPQILDKLNQVTNPLPVFSHKPDALQAVVRGIGHLCGDNIYSGVQLLGEINYPRAPAMILNINAGAAVTSEAIQSRFGAVGIHIAVSSISRRKSNCAKVAVAAAGNYLKGIVTHLTCEKLFKRGSSILVR